jgi:hypothetical protein
MCRYFLDCSAPHGKSLQLHAHHLIQNEAEWTPNPDPLLLRKSGRGGNWTRNLWTCSQKLWILDHRGGHCCRDVFTAPLGSNARDGDHRKHLSSVLRAFASAGIWMPSYCLAINYYGFQASCHSIVNVSRFGTQKLQVYFTWTSCDNSSSLSIEGRSWHLPKTKEKSTC